MIAMVSNDWTDLFLRALGGDQQSYALFLRQVATRLRPKIKRSLGAGCSGVEAEDIVQDILLAIHLKRNTWDVNRPAGPWVWGIANHKLIDAFRKRGRNVEVLTDFLEEADSFAAPEAEQDHGDAGRLLSQLPERAQLIVRRLTMEGASPSEVAVELKMTEGALRVALHRALKSLAAIYRKGDL